MKDVFSKCHPAVNFLFFVGAIGCSVVIQHPAYLLAGACCGTIYYFFLNGRKGWKMILGLLRVYPKFCVNSNEWRKIGRNNIVGVVALTPPLGYSINRKLHACQGQRLPGRCSFYP